MKNAIFTLAATLTIGWLWWQQPVGSHELVTTTVTYDREIVRIVKKKCVACHSDNNLSVPFTSYEQTRPWARAIEEEILRGHMPPWRAAAGYGQFVNDNGLTNRELSFLISWIEGNGPKSKQDSLIVDINQARTTQAERIKPDFARWELGKPDLLKPFEGNVIAPGQPDEVRSVTVDLGLSSPQSLRALEFKPGDRRVVRAAFFSLQETGQWLGSWTPWYGVTTLPKDTAYEVPAGSHVVAEIHYRSAEAPVTDRPTLGLYFAAAPASHHPMDLVVEAGAEGTSSLREQKFHGSVKLAADTRLLAFKPEVQPGLESIEVSARKPDGSIQVLLLVRGVEPKWPTPYILTEPLLLPRDTELSVTAYSRSSETLPAPAGVKMTMSAYSDASSTEP